MMGCPQQWSRGQNTRAGIWGDSHRAGGGSAMRSSSSGVRTNLKLGLKKKKPFSPSLTVSPTFSPNSCPLLLLPPMGSQPSWGRCVPCQGSASLARAGCCMGETARMHRRAVPRASGCTATPGTHARVPAKCRGQPHRHLVLCAPPKAGGERASAMSRKGSADGGASSVARPAHCKCSEFLAGQNTGCWGYLFI